MAAEKKYSVAGFISRTHGLKGELKVKLSSPFSFADMLVKGAVMLEIKGKPVPHFLDTFNDSGTDIIIKLQDINHVDRAQGLVGLHILADDKLLTESDENQLKQLKEFLLIDKNLGEIGRVTDVTEMPAHPLLTVNFNGEEVLVPLVDDFVIEIKKRKKEIHVELPEGLLNLNK
ncbi:MAG: ribosome maturation factor RimM [Bacteroidia bacterium]|nr:ribosome maturation factor RimM [Bacteroidia bacterium]